MGRDLSASVSVWITQALKARHTVRSLARTNKARRPTYGASPSPPVGSKTIRVALENKKT